MNNKNIITIFILIFAFYFFLLPSSVSAETLTLTSSLTEIRPAGSFSVYIDIDEISDLEWFSFNLSFNKAILNFTGAESGNAMQIGGCLPVISSSDDGHVYLSRYICDGLDVTATTSVNRLVKLNFVAISTGTSTISTTDELLVSSASTTIQGYIWGNTNIIVSNNADITAPARSDGLPSGTLTINTTDTELSLQTDEAATCRFSLQPNQDYDLMSQQFNGNNLIHTYSLNNLTNGSNYRYYIKCKDVVGNKNLLDYNIIFNVASEAAISLTPSNSSIIIGGDYYLTYHINNFENINWLESYINYDDDFLSFDEAYLERNSNFLEGEGWDIMAAANEDRIDIMVMNLDVGAAMSSSSDVFTMHFTGINSGVVNFTYYNDAGIQNNIYNTEGQSVDAIWTTASLTILDNNNPIINITSPTIDGTYSTNNSSLSLSGSTTDTNGITEITFKNNDMSIASVAVNPSELSYDFNETFSLSLGLNTIEVVAKNSLGNYATDTLAVTYSLPDTNPPAISNGSPSNALPISTSRVTMIVSTDENATCKYSTNNSLSYELMENIFTNTGGQMHSVNLSGLANGLSYTYYIKCIDSHNNANLDNYTINFSVSEPDNSSPVLSNIMPGGDLPENTTSTTLSFETNELASCRYSLAEDQSYYSMTIMNATSTSHSLLINNLVNGSTYAYYIKCRDITGNISEDNLIYFSVNDNSAPVISNKAPSGNLAANTSQTFLSFNTDEIATCRYSVTSGILYDSMAVFTLSATTTHSLLINGLTNGNTFNYYIKCSDAFNNISSDSLITFTIQNSSSNGGGGGGGGGSSVSNVSSSETVNTVVIGTTTREIDKVILNWKNPNIINLDKIIVIKTTTQIFDYLSFDALKAMGEKVYEGNDQSFIDKNIELNISYYYAIFVKTKSDKYSKPIIVLKSALTQSDKENSDAKSSQELLDKYSLKNLGGVSGSVVDEISQAEANEIFNYNKRVTLSSVTVKLYNYIINKSPHALTEQDKYAIAEFIHNGTPTSRILGAGERTGVINSYLSAFKKLPRSDEEWQDVIKIANGRWPNEQNDDAENNASNKYFTKVYNRKPNMKNANDNAAVSVIAYGLRPATRNTNSEFQAVKIFKAIYKYSPVSAIDWDIVRAIAYSGAIR